MKRIYSGLFLSLLFILSFQPTASSQTIELLSGNTLNGAMNGTLLGGATMALTNDTDFAPLRVGLGLGTLYGIGMGAYDITGSSGRKVLVSGTFNDGNNTSIIVLLDTFYGAAAGAVVVTAVMLVANEPLIEGMQYGAGIGAWAGFGFGLIDAFTLSERSTVTNTAFNPKTNSNADGLVGINFDQKTSIGLFSPSVIGTYQVSSKSLQQEISPAVQLLNLKVNF